MSRFHFTVLRLCVGRKLLLAVAAYALVVFYELVQLMLISYGSAGQVEILGIDLPPLVLAAEAFGRSAAPWLIVPFIACSRVGEHISNGYIDVIQSGGGDSRALALRFMLAATILASCSAVLMCLFVLLVCMLFCRGTLDIECMAALSNAGVRILMENTVVNYGIALIAGMLRVVAIGVASMAISLVVRSRHAGVLAIPLLWLALSYTPAMAMVAGVFGALGLTLGVITMPAYSLMAYVDTAYAFHAFMFSELLSCCVVVATAFLVSFAAPRALRVKPSGVLGGWARDEGRGNA